MSHFTVHYRGREILRTPHVERAIEVMRKVSARDEIPHAFVRRVGDGEMIDMAWGDDETTAQCRRRYGLTAIEPEVLIERIRRRKTACAPARGRR